MRFSTTLTVFQQAVSLVSRAVNAKPSLPVLSGLQLKAIDEHTIQVLGTDLQLGIEKTFPATVNEMGICVIPARPLLEALQHSSGETLECFGDEKEWVMKGKTVRTTLRPLTTSDFPAFPDTEGEQFPVDPVRFEQMVRMVAFASSTDESRPILGAVSFVFTSGGMEVAATDGFRLALFAQKKEASSTTSEEMTSDVAQTQVGATQKVLLPAKAITEVIKAMQKVKTDECVLQYSSRLKQLFFVTQSARMIVRQQEGNFPPYEKIVPDEVKTQIALERTVLERLVKAAIAFGRDGGGILQLELEYDVLHARSSSPTMGAFEESVPVELIKGGEEKQTIAFTAKYLQDFLSHVEDDVVWFGMNESLRPAVFSPAKLPELRYVVMPFRVQK